MSNVINVSFPSARTISDRLAALSECFCVHRRLGDDVFWLKENAEFLNILECTAQTASPNTLAPFEGFYRNVDQRLAFFPQYYRFLLSITLDLEALGMPGNKSEAMIDWLIAMDGAGAELSDLQRAEARRLMLRRGVNPSPHDLGLDDRLRLFCDRKMTFTTPNKKAAYELTHTVFYLSEYGRKDPLLGANTLTSLYFAGALAYLDQNADLLAEVCVALKYAGQIPSPMWIDWLARELALYHINDHDPAPFTDDYHEFFVCNWALAACRPSAPLFQISNASGRLSFHAAQGRVSALREVSLSLFQMAQNRSADWDKMRETLGTTLSEPAYEILLDAEKSIPEFDAFFAGFARCDRVDLSHADRAIAQ